ncbi:ABC transporter ATP-binding protein [Sulfurospirillum diekertiae]|nr:ABC transporter ATP-binding protein [Sulfurospirillum diekertiae]QEH06320.1 lipid A export ATP-binding/permease protein MsbA-like [Sulfurospirillum multivorans]WNZ00317.1 ABC transporter ATP-binding protein [Sulfurospirillum sp. 'SP']ARU48785.1 lipid A export ATP-binding/permease protein MsbA-like [Sulfurospirillum diekertiae]ASC93607.1 lipid A export ATP-binding/permease protein MsbA-like [Sulfurospirillum diekertiae]ATB69651.1 lipid A export ATP-binding/permease protein MsbA-like [Sulfuro
MRYIWSYYQNHLSLFYTTVASTFLLAFLDILFPYIVQLMISEDFIASNGMKMTLMFLLLGGIIILRSLAVWVRNYWGSLLGINVEFDMRNDLFKHINTLSFSYFDNTKTGSLMSRVVSDIAEVSKVVTEIPRDLLLIPITLIGAIGVMLSLNLKLGMVVLLLMPVLIFFTYYKNTKLRHAYMSSKRKIAHLNAQLTDSFEGIRVVQAFSNEAHEMHKFKQSNQAYKEMTAKAFKALADLRSISNFFSGALQVIIIAYGIYLVQYEHMSIGVLFAFVLYIDRFMRPIRNFISLTEVYQKGLVGMDRFQELMQIKSTVRDDAKEEMESVKGHIAFNNVNFTYEEQGEGILKDINFTITPQEHIALVGGTGSGKSTLCALIMRFYEPQIGSIKIDGKDIKEVSVKSLRRQIGIVQQDVFLFNGTIKENILYGRLEASEEEVIAAAKKANIHEFVMGLAEGYESVVGERGIKLSGGQKQQLSIARIFLKDPAILILDEATSALDNITEHYVQKSLDALAQNRTVITIAHRLSSVKNASKILVMKNGRIAEEGTHKELLSFNGVYQTLHDLQFREGKER